MVEAQTVPYVVPAASYEQQIRAEDRRLLEKEREFGDGGFIVRCLSDRCYRLRDNKDWGTGKPGLYIMFELPE